MCTIFVSIFTFIDLILPQILRKIVDEGIARNNLELLIKYVFLYLFLQLFSVVIEFLLSYLYSIMRNSVAVNLRLKILKHFSELSGKYYTNKRSGNILSIVQSDIDIIEAINAELVLSIIKDAITAIFSLYFMVKIQKELFVFVMITQLILVFLQRYFSKNIHDNIEKIRREYGEITNVVQEYILNIMNIVISKSRIFFVSDYIKKERKIIQKKIRTDLLFSGNVSVAMLINSLITVTLYGYGGYKIIKGGLTLGELLAFQGYSTMLIGPCMSIINANNTIQRARVSIDRFYNLLDEKSDVEEKKKSVKINENDLQILELEKINFSYIKNQFDSNDLYISDTQTIKDVSMKFLKDSVSAIVGSSGCGKSTIASLIYRLWDVDSGEILVDTTNIKEINMNSLRKKISIITQETVMFDGSIRENICLNKKISKESLTNLCEKVGLNEYIEGLNDGIDTQIGERGTKVSGGQKQRIAIARAILNNSDIIIFDEATSALDNISQKKILKNIKPYFKDKIVIIIAHRLSTIKDVDKIYVMDKGRVVEFGTHEELIKMRGKYYELYSSEN